MSYADRNWLFDTDVNSWLEGIAGNGVISGLGVTAQSPASMKVDVAAGIAMVNGIRVEIAATTGTLASDATHPRKGILTLNSSGTVTVTMGTAAAAVPTGRTGPSTKLPAPADIPANQIILAEVWVPAAATTIVTANIAGRGITIAPKVAATFVVAASDSVQPSRADWQCSGADDDVQVQEAITAGDTLFLAGTYDITAIVLVPSDRTVRGEGRGTCFKLADDMANVDVFRNSDITNGNTGITIRDLRIDGNRANQSASRYGIYFKNVDYSSVLNCWIESCYLQGIRLALSDRNLVQGCELYDSRLANLGVAGSSSNRILGNLVHASAEDFGIGVGNEDATPSIFNVISGNTLRDNNFEGLGMTSGQDRNMIIGNLACFNGDNGISVSGQFNTVVGNVADSNQYHGIGLAGSDFNLIRGNICLSNGQAGGADYAGIRLTNGATYNVLEGNLCKGASQQYGIAIYDGTGSSDNNRVTNNMLQGNATGPYLDGGTNVIQFNYGYVTENSGTSSITSGQTTKAVAHGLSATPTKINIEFREQGTADYGRWWVDTIGAANFTLNVSADPGASNLDFAWEAKVR